MADPQKNEDHDEEELRKALGDVGLVAVTPQQFANITAINTALMVLMSSSIEHCRTHVPTLHCALGCVEAKTNLVLDALGKYGLGTVDKNGLITLSDRGMERATSLAVFMVRSAVQTRDLAPSSRLYRHGW